MIFFEVTQARRSRHFSGLMRVSARLRAELSEAVGICWDSGTKGWRTEAGTDAAEPGPGDWLLTSEVFSEVERPGFSAWLAARRCQVAAIYHDAIPLRFPEITWPQSVARHPYYLKMLSRFDRVWAVSDTSRRELLAWWKWLGVDQLPPVGTIALGADVPGAPRPTSSAPTRGLQAGRRNLVSVGIVEPRKNQSLLVDVCAGLWDEGLTFELWIFGRINPHFGKPIEKKIRAAARHYPGLHFVGGGADREVDAAFANARASVFPTLAEGCGLPLLESLWRGVPCVCSDLPVLRENVVGGGCVPVPVNDQAAWTAALRKILSVDSDHARLVQEAISRPLPTWAAAAQFLREELAAN